MPESLKSEIKLLARHALVYGGGIVLGQIVSLLLLPFYTHFLSTNDYGIKELIALTLNFVSILFATTLSSAFFRFYFEYEEQNEKREIVGTIFIGIAILWCIAAGIFLPLTNTISTLLFDTQELSYYLEIAFVTLFISTWNQLGYNYLRANQQSVRTVILSIVRMLITIGFTIYFVAVVKIGVLGILIGNLIGNSVMFFVLVCPIFWVVGFKFSLSKFKEMAKFGLPLIPSQLGNFAVNVSDRYFLKSFLSISDAGIYSVGYRFGTLTSNFIAVPFNQIWNPRRLEVYRQENSEKIFGKIFTYFLFLMIYAGLFIAVLTRELLIILTPEQYWSAYNIVPIIVLSITIFSMHNHFNIGIFIHKKTIYYTYIDIINGILVLLLNYFLIKNYGIYGAAIATLIAHSFRSTMIYFLSKKHHKIFFEFKRISKLIIVAFFLYFLTTLLNFESVATSFTFKFMFLALYPFFIFLIGFYSEDEINNMKNMVRFFKNGERKA